MEKEKNNFHSPNEENLNFDDVSYSHEEDSSGLSTKSNESSNEDFKDNAILLNKQPLIENKNKLVEREQSSKNYQAGSKETEPNLKIKNPWPSKYKEYRSLFKHSKTKESNANGNDYSLSMTYADGVQMNESNANETGKSEVSLSQSKNDTKSFSAYKNKREKILKYPLKLNLTQNSNDTDFSKEYHDVEIGHWNAD